MRIRSVPVIVTLLVLPLAVTHVRADDGGIAFGGTPRLLTGHPSVSMRSEVVRMTVGRETVHVDCQFVFRNDGPACKVRMGFPDQARGAMDPEESGPVKHPTGTFTSYLSSVDGVPVPTELIRADTEGNYWHAKVVNFPAHATRHVHDAYSVPLGGRIVDHGSISQAYYVLHTGSSWHGPIGRAEIDVTFAPGTVPMPLVPVSLSAAPSNDDALYGWSRHPRGVVLYRGPSPAHAQGLMLHFLRTNFKPAYRDDVLLSFGFHPSNTQ